MITIKRRQMLAAFAGLMIVASSPAGAKLNAPDGVRIGLRIMNQVVGHTGRLIMAGSYDQLPREGREFDEGSGALRTAIAGEPAPFKARVDPLLKRAVAASHTLSETSKSHDGAKIRAAHDAFATAVHTVIVQFPEDVRPPGVITLLKDR